MSYGIFFGITNFFDFSLFLSQACPFRLFSHVCQINDTHAAFMQEMLDAFIHFQEGEILFQGLKTEFIINNYSTKYVQVI